MSEDLNKVIIVLCLINGDVRKGSSMTLKTRSSTVQLTFSG
jgi:hypothetical protein